jgi:hypothetical protein
MDECQTPAVDGLHAVLAQRHLGGEERHVLHVAAQVKIESKIEAKLKAVGHMLISSA